MNAGACYERPQLAWVKRRARRLQRFYRIDRRLAVFDAMRDYTEFCVGRCARLVSIPGGKQG